VAKHLEVKHPGAAASLLEGLEDTLTVTRLGLSPRLQRTFKSTNPIESMISISRTVAGNVKRWRSGSMALRWTGLDFWRPKSSSDASTVTARWSSYAAHLNANSQEVQRRATSPNISPGSPEVLRPPGHPRGAGEAVCAGVLFTSQSTTGRAP
jgi:hypothetical protein